MRTLRSSWFPSVVAAALALPGPVLAAAASPQVTVVGGAAVPAQAPGSDQITYVISVGDGPVAGAVLHAAEPPDLPADPTSVVVDGLPARPGTVDPAGPGLVVRLGAGANHTHGGSLATGNHTVTFTIVVDSLPTGSASAQALVDYVVGGQTRTARSQPIPLAMPDLRLTKPAGGGENRVLPLGTGVDGDFEAILTNPGGNSAAAMLTITLPRGLAVDRSFGIYRDDQYRSVADSGGVRLQCSSSRPTSVRCALGAVASGTNALIDVPVQPVPSAPAGRVGTFTLSVLSGNGLERNPANNTVRGSVRFTGTAHLTVHLLPRVLRVPVGRTGRLTASIRNDGPNRAAQTLGLIELRGYHFTITRFSGRRGPFGSGIGTATRAHWGVRVPRTAREAAGDRGVPEVLWKAGTIRPGGTVRASVTIKALAAGRDEMLFGGDSSAGNPPCQHAVPTPKCKAFTFATLRATPRVRPHRPATRSTSPVATTTDGAGHTQPVLASTGPRSAGLMTTVGLGAIATGAVFAVLGRRRRIPRAH